MAFDKKKFIGKFVEEAKEHIDMLNNGILALENNPCNLEAMNQVFRSAHTIKGTSNILSLNEVSEVAHKLEDALGALRDKKIHMSKSLFDLLFKTVDTLTEMTDLIKKDHPIDISIENICNELEQAICGKLEESVQENESTMDTEKNSPELHEEIAPEWDETTKATTPKSTIKETLRIDTDKLDKTVKLAGEIISIHGRMKENLVAFEAFEKQFRQFMTSISGVGNGNQSSTNGCGEETSRVLRKLYSDLKHLGVDTRESLNIHALLTNDLRDKVLEMRMMPLSTVFGAFPRMIRDLSTAHGKQVNLILEGSETELDKKIIEKIGDPLVHIIRNCFDHGLEMPEERVRLGKPEKGTIKISANYEGGVVLIEVNDDGAGIGVDKIKKRALKKNMFDKETLGAMSKAEIINLIFRPGFTTSPIITDISGRGVGMDVVRENIVENLKGSIQIESDDGKGTKFIIRLPLTLAIMPVLLVVASNHTFAISINSVDEIFRISQDQIINVVGKRAIRHHEQIIAIISLAEILEIPEEHHESREEELILLVTMGSEKLGLIVNSVIKEENVEIIPVPPQLEHLELVAGATLLGKDEVISLLNVTRIFALARKVKDDKYREKRHQDKKKICNILVVDDSINTREIEKNILESCGYKVELASDGVDGFTKAREFQYDLIVTDVEMPRLDGFSFAEKLRQEEDYKNVPIIIVTSRDQEADKRRGIEVGADAYIVKGSFDQSNLLNTVQSLIG